MQILKHVKTQCNAHTQIHTHTHIPHIHIHTCTHAYTHRAAGCDGMHLFSLDPAAGGHVYTRNLSPLVLMEEEAASASANAALAA